MPTPSPDRQIAIDNFYTTFPALSEGQPILEPAIQVLDYGPGEVLFQRGSPVAHVYFLLTGSVDETGLKRLADGTRLRRLERIVEPSRVLGLYDFLYQQPHSTHAIARELSQVLLVDVKALEKLIYHRPDLPELLAPLSIIQRLRTIPLLHQLDLIELSYVADATQPREYAAGTTIYQADLAPADELYLLDQGQVQISEVGGELALLGNGAAFGLPGVDARATAVNDVAIFAIPYQDLTALTPVDVMSEGPTLRQAVVATLAQLRVFADPEYQQQLRKLAGFVSHYFLPDKYLIVQQGEFSDSMWVLLPGSRAKIYALDSTGQALTTTGAEGPLDFCEGALLAQALVEATVEAEANSQWLRLHRLDFQAFVRENGYDLLRKLNLRTDILPLVGKAAIHERYPWLQDGEGVVLLRRRHWFILLAKTWFALLLGIVLLMSFAVAPAFPLAGLWLLPVLMLAGVGVLLFLIWQLIDYWNDYIVVTTRRVVRQEVQLLRTVHLQEAALEHIQNVDVDKPFPGSWLGFGVLTIQTAGTRGLIRFDYIPNVEDVKRAIDAQRTRRLRYRQTVSKQEIQQYLERRLGLTLRLPERVRVEGAKPTLMQSWGEQLQHFFERRGKQRKRREQQDHVVWHKHWLVLVQGLFWPVLILVGTLGLLLIEILLATAWLASLITQPLSLLLALAALICLGVIAWRYTDWHNDTYEVTRDEVADVEKLPLFFDEKRRTARLLDIDNIRSEVPSTLHYLLNYGNVQLETAAEAGDFTFDSISNPNGVVAEIRRRIEDARRRQEAERARQRARELTDWFEVYSRLNS